MWLSCILFDAPFHVHPAHIAQVLLHPLLKPNFSGTGISYFIIETDIVAFGKLKRSKIVKLCTRIDLIDSNQFTKNVETE